MDNMNFVMTAFSKTKYSRGQKLNLSDSIGFTVAFLLANRKIKLSSTNLENLRLWMIPDQNAKVKRSSIMEWSVWTHLIMSVKCTRMWTRFVLTTSSMLVLTGIWFCMPFWSLTSSKFCFSHRLHMPWSWLTSLLTLIRWLTQN
jgi:hypothetical protein